MPAKRKKNTKTVETLTHTDEVRANIPTVELQPVMEDDAPVHVTYERNRDLDPQFVWRGRTYRTGRIWWCRRRRSSSRKRFIRRY